MTSPDPWTLALARERSGYLGAGKPDKIGPVDEELAARGWCVDAEGDLQPLEKSKGGDAPERADEPKGETAAPEKAQHRTRRAAKES